MSDRLAAAVLELVDALREEVAAGAERPPGPDQLLSVDQAATALGVARSTAYQEIQAGRLHSLKIGKRRMIASSAIADYIRAAGSVR